MRNHSQTRRKRASREGGWISPSPGRRPPGAKNKERKPASRSIPSDWYEEKSCAAATKERKRMVQIAQAPRGQTLSVSRMEAARPTATRSESAVCEVPSQSSDGTCQSAESDGPCPSASNNSEAGRIPREPMSPWIWKASERNAERKMSPSPRNQRKRGQSI